MMNCRSTRWQHMVTPIVEFHFTSFNKTYGTYFGVMIHCCPDCNQNQIHIISFSNHAFLCWLVKGLSELL